MSPGAVAVKRSYAGSSRNILTADQKTPGGGGEDKRKEAAPEGFPGMEKKNRSFSSIMKIHEKMIYHTRS